MPRTLIVVCTVCAASGSCGGEDTGPTERAYGIAQGEARPACTSTVGHGRTPYAMPQLVGSGWASPVKLGDAINTPCPEDAIEVSRDGRSLYFMWSPEVNAAPDELLHGTTGTYVASKSGNGPGDFSLPTFFDLRRGTQDGGYDAEVSFSPDESKVYFHSTRAENTGYRQSPAVDDPLDIYVADIINGVPSAARNLDAPVNSTALDGEHCLSPDGTKLYVTSTRPGGLGGADIWVSQWDGASWSTPVNLGAPINSTGSDLQPAFAANDSSTMYFVSDRDGASGIYASHFDGSAWSTPARILTGYVGEPSLVADGSLLYFVHVSVDAAGVFGSDVWFAARHGAGSKGTIQ